MKQFDVVILKNNEKAIIKKVISKKEFIVQIMSDDKNTEEKEITNKDIEKVLYSKQKQREIIGVNSVLELALFYFFVKKSTIQEFNDIIA